MNVLACDSLSEAFQRQYQFTMHKKRLSEISVKREPSALQRNGSYESLRLELIKNKLKRRHNDAQDRLADIQRSNKALLDRISRHFKQKRNPEYENTDYSASKLLQSTRIVPEQVKQKKIAEENGQMLERLLFPGRQSPSHPSIVRELREHQKAVKCGEHMQKCKQAWRVRFKQIWAKSKLPPIQVTSTEQKRSREKAMEGFRSVRNANANEEKKPEMRGFPWKARAESPKQKGAVKEEEDFCVEEAAEEVVEEAAVADEVGEKEDYADDFEEK